MGEGGLLAGSDGHCSPGPGAAEHRSESGLSLAAVSCGSERFGRAVLPGVLSIVSIVFLSLAPPPWVLFFVSIFG